MWYTTLRFLDENHDEIRDKTLHMPAPRIGESVQLDDRSVAELGGLPSRFWKVIDVVYPVATHRSFVDVVVYLEMA